MQVTASMVKVLRDKTGAGMMDAKKALVEVNGDIEKAIVFLREKGLANAGKRAGKIAAEGIVDSYIHIGGKVGVLLELNCETDFVAITDDFKALAHDICIHIAAANPRYLSPEEVDSTEIEKESEIIKQQAINDGKPEKVVEKIVEGRIKKYYSEICLLKQPYVKDPDITIETLVDSLIAKIGEKISIRRFTRYEMGEGIEKKVDDFASEVMEQMGKA